MRTIAATLVLLGHAEHFLGAVGGPYRPTGWIQTCLFEQGFQAVQFFFVLSGYLITRLVFIQMDLPGGFSLRSFWLRRVARIWPVYYMVVATAALLAWRAGPFFGMPNNNWALLLGFLENFDLMRLLKANQFQGLVVSVLWSVSIEEQFYLVYPVFLMLIPRRLRGHFLIVVVLVAGFIKQRNLVDVFHTLSACYELGLGCLLAWLLHGREPATFPAPLCWLPYLLLFLPFAPEVKSLLRPLLFAAIICDQAFCQRSWVQTRFIPGLNPLGKLTYGLYSYHMVVVMLVCRFIQTRGHAPQGPLGFCFYLFLVWSLSVGLSWLSYRWMERPLLKLAPR
ncbi:acyltransferase [bacterium]|nr:acyltransferase [bacterium]